MKKTINLATVNIDGQKLKAAREDRGISAADIAASLTLSRAQIIHIEEGGDKPFYSAEHKLLAVRKYANALNIPYAEVVITEGAEQIVPVPKATPPIARTYSNNLGDDLSQIGATDDRMTAAARNSENRRRVVFGAVALCVIIAMYAKLRGTAEEAILPESPLVQEESLSDAPATEAPVAIQAPAAEPVIADTIAETESVTDQSDATDLSSAESRSTAEAEASKPAVVAADQTLQASASASENNCPTETAAGDLKSWTPAYQRKNDTRLFVISAKGGTVCVTDNNGKTKLVSLRPMVGEPFVGQPPYIIRSSQLSSFDMYMQGLRVKVPADAKVMRLIPTTNRAPEPETVTDSTEIN